MSISTLYQRLVKAAGSVSHPAIIEDQTQWTYADLKEKSARLASSLTQKGIQPGDKVAIMLMNQKEYIVSFLALRLLGAVVVPINIQMPPDDIRFVIVHSETKMIITNPTFAPNFSAFPIPLLVTHSDDPHLPSWEDAVNQGSPEFSAKASNAELTYPDLHVLIYTSGTTGQPKGVMLSEANLIANLDGIDPVLHLQSDDRILLALPLFHAYGLMIGLYILDKAGSMVLVPNFAPKKIVENLIAHQVTILPLVPTMFSVLLQAIQKAGADQFKSLRACISGGASLPAALLKQIESALDIVVLEGYGMTETAPVLAVNNPKRGSIPGSVGKPLPNVQMQLGDVESTPDGLKVGEILVKGDNVMAGYYKNPEATQETFTAEGFLKTGDLGHFDEDGNLFISGGRKKDLIIKAGENISPLRIEQVLYAHPDIQEASVIGIPDNKLGEDILACIQLKPDIQQSNPDLKALQQNIKTHCLSQLTPLLIPAYFRFYDELPKNPTGKIMKKTLREQNRDLMALKS